MKTVLIMFYFVFLLCFLLHSDKVVEDKKHKVELDRFKDAAEMKMKIWYDPQIKKELAASYTVTKRYVKNFFKKKIIDVNENYEIDFAVPLKLANGEIISSTRQLPFYLK